jgi:hypothetical protein
VICLTCCQIRRPSPSRWTFLEPELPRLRPRFQVVDSGIIDIGTPESYALRMPSLPIGSSGAVFGALPCRRSRRCRSPTGWDGRSSGSASTLPRALRERCEAALRFDRSGGTHGKKGVDPTRMPVARGAASSRTGRRLVSDNVAGYPPPASGVATAPCPPFSANAYPDQVAVSRVGPVLRRGPHRAPAPD